MNDKSNPVQETRKRRLWPLTLTVFLLILSVLFQIWQQKRLEAKLDSFPNTVSQQTSVVHRALGKAIPIELPESLTNDLAALEKQVRNEASWPKSSVEADAMLTKLRDLVRAIPPWAEEDLLPRLNAVRWAVSALALSAQSNDVTDNQLVDFLDNIETVIEAKPASSSELVAIHLTGVQSKLNARLESFQLKTAITDSERLIKDGGEPAAFAEIEERLSEWAAVPEFKESIGTLLKSIRSRALSDDVANLNLSVEKTMLGLHNEPSSMIRQLTLGRLMDSVVSQRQLVVEKSATPELETQKLTRLSMEIEKAIETEARIHTAEQDKKLRAYQGWALGQIQKFNDDMNIAEKADKGTIYDSADYTRIKDGMVSYLVPISVGLLDPAVNRLYSEAFERGWKQLDGKNQKHLQTELAQQEAIVEKRKP